ncbi:hypothetical protein [Saccharomonospora saliphila]|uniref:hypothetical protein n=1 Tax=Saccharomonospora saliphila TaxID=369829 RepID=UPI0003A77807|nr:hypothetical protein [Saccharomonospora saliphila]
MLIVAVKPGHDGAVAVVRDRTLRWSLEQEKDSFPRHSPLIPSTILGAAELLDRVPDVVALGGWKVGRNSIGAGYHGVDAPALSTTRLFGAEITVVTSSHVRSHVMMALGMAPPRPRQAQQAVLVWEGVTGAFYLVDDAFEVVRTVPVLTQPGARYALLFALADPTFPDTNAVPDLADSGKLMALAAYSDASAAGDDLVATVEDILALDTVYPAPKAAFRDSPVYNAGVEAEVTKHAAALLSDTIFDRFLHAAKETLPPPPPRRSHSGSRADAG